MEQKSKADVEKHLREEKKQGLRERIDKYKQERDTVRAYVESDPTIPIREKRANSEQLLVEVQKLKDVWSEVMPYIRKIKSIVGDVLGETRFVASYLLFGKVSQGLDAILMLLSNGFYYEAIEILRSNREALDLIPLFLHESDDSPLIKKWFAGEIVSNATAREAADRLLKETAEKAGLTFSMEGLKSGIYSGLSHYSHVSYTALLDAYDVYSQDFDFERIAGHYYALNTGVSYARTEIHSVIITLKVFYKSVGDRESYSGVDALLRKHAPTYYDEEARQKRHADIEERFTKKARDC